MNKSPHDLRARPAPMPGRPGRLRALLPLAALLSACSTTPPPPPPPPAPEPRACVPEPAPQAELDVTPSPVGILLAYHQNLRALSPAELAREMAHLNGQDKSPMLSLRKAMVLSIGRAANDLSVAQIHLDTVLSGTDDESEALKPLARLLGTQWSEQRRLSDSLDRLNTQARDNQRKTEQLNEKLEALKAIERTLPASPAAPGPAAGASPSVKQQGG